MSVSEAVQRRRSIRAFLPTPVPQATIVEILELARRAPSGGNLQPWRIDVVSDDAAQSLKALMAQRLASGETEEAEYPIYPDALWEPHRSYRYRVGEEMYGLLDAPREDRALRRRHFEENFRLFGAPVGLFFSIDRRFGAPQWSDIGMLMQTIMLLAVEHDLGTCAQECWSLWPKTMRNFLGLGSQEMFFAGMAIGYPNPEAPINSLHTERAPVETFTRFHCSAPGKKDIDQKIGAKWKGDSDPRPFDGPTDVHFHGTEYGG
ncbi:nitroreductase family protein [Sphingobium lactosutens]|nr:nitroreductase family protein [Sphingobium lactosutens]